MNNSKKTPGWKSRCVWPQPSTLPALPTDKMETACCGPFCLSRHKALPLPPRTPVRFRGTWVLCSQQAAWFKLSGPSCCCLGSLLPPFLHVKILSVLRGCQARCPVTDYLLMPFLRTVTPPPRIVHRALCLWLGRLRTCPLGASTAGSLMTPCDPPIGHGKLNGGFFWSN